jgi:hypothetical protein
MGLFNRKPKISIQEWCEDFYGNYVFAPRIGNVDPWQVFCETNRKMISQSDSNFSQVNDSELSDQLLALRLEVIGIAWIIHVKDNLAPKQSECTRLYLLNHGQERFWDMMEPYNQATAKSTVGGSDSSTRTGRAHITFMNSMRMQLFDKWITTVSDAKDAARAANRIGSNVPWKANRTHVYLSFALADQLECEFNDEARMGIMAVIQGFFNGASEELQKVKIFDQIR